MNIKPTKKKIIFSLIPLYLLILQFPFLIEMKFGGFMETPIGMATFGIAILAYFFFLTLAFPFYGIFMKLGLMEGASMGIMELAPPMINIYGLLILVVFYSAIFYLLISVLSRSATAESDNFD